MQRRMGEGNRENERGYGKRQIEGEGGRERNRQREDKGIREVQMERGVCKAE